MSKAATGRYLKSGGHVPGGWFMSRLRGDINRIAPLLTFPMLRKMSPTKWESAMSCNLGVWRSDFDQVGGFDERYLGWGYEDSDLVIRLIRTGVGRKNGRFATGVIHLWHEPNDQLRSEQNLTRLLQVVAAG
jgi:GT2 family glycosyltransferase